jgi:hypothetical protein
MTTVIVIEIGFQDDEEEDGEDDEEYESVDAAREKGKYLFDLGVAHK